MCDLEKAEQQAGADHPEHEHHKAGNEQDQHDGKQQRQQQQQIDRRKAAERQQRRRGIAQAVMILPAAEPGFGAQLRANRRGSPSAAPTSSSARPEARASWK